MKLVTFQPLKALRDIENKGRYTPSIYNPVVGDRVFCIKVDKDTMETIHITAPSMPQVLIEFEVDDSEVEVIDYVEWINYLHNFRSKYVGRYAEKVLYKEYTVNYIDAKSVTHTEVICSSSNPDLVQDMFMDHHFDEYEKLSGHKWRHNKDAKMRSFWSSEDAYNMVSKVTKCMIPDKILTEDDVTLARQLIRDVYIIE